jgi:hypothetical protein
MKFIREVFIQIKLINMVLDQMLELEHLQLQTKQILMIQQEQCLILLIQMEMEKLINKNLNLL